MACAPERQPLPAGGRVSTMRIRNVVVVLIAACAVTGSRERQREVEVSTAAALQALLAERLVDTRIRLASGEYHLRPSEAIDSTCGNCEDPNTPGSIN